VQSSAELKYPSKEISSSCILEGTFKHIRNASKNTKHITPTREKKLQQNNSTLFGNKKIFLKYYN
jgi:hypothetical protein